VRGAALAAAAAAREVNSGELTALHALEWSAQQADFEAALAEMQASHATVTKITPAVRRVRQNEHANKG
jgi:hypothetical protein